MPGFPGRWDVPPGPQLQVDKKVLEVPVCPSGEQGVRKPLHLDLCPGAVCRSLPQAP